ncbi:MAG: hypothetical protein ABR589_13605, partial [Chthoniobacterales bacterium]
VVERVYAVADPAKDMMAHLRDMFGESKGDYRDSIANVSAITGTFKEKLPPMLQKVDALVTQVTTAMETTNAALLDVKATMANANELSASTRGLLV